MVGGEGRGLNGRPVRLATFNIQHGRGSSGVELASLRRACADLGADVLALQEVDVGTRRVGAADLASEVAEACAMAADFGATVQLPPGEFGNALLVRGVLEDVERIPLPEWPGGEPRGALLAAAVLDAGPRLSVAACHLGLGRRRRQREAVVQLRAVVHELSARPPPRALLGDLNLDVGEVEPLVEAAGLTLAGGPPTHPAHRPSRRIDHVAVAGLTVTAVVVARAPVSDHRPLLVEAVTSTPDVPDAAGARPTGLKGRD